MPEEPGQSRFLVLGRAGMDLYADPPGTRTEEAAHFTAALGGSAANIAAGIVKLGGAASLVTDVSDDAVGRFVLRELDRYGVDGSYVRVLGGELRTSLAVVETRLQDCQSVIYRNGAADFALTEDDIAGVRFPEYAALIVTGTALALDPSRSATLMAMSRARTAQLRVILDVDYRPYSWRNAPEAAETYREAASLSDMIIGNDIEFDVMAGGDGGLEFAREFSLGRDAVIYKMGENGSITFSGDGQFETPIDRVTAIKPTGAGDAFLAGLVMGLWSGFDLRSSVRRGTAAAAIAVMRVGCAPACPTLPELEDFMQSRPRPA